MTALALSGPAHAAHLHDDAEATVAILMFDGVQIIDFAAPYEVFGQAHFNVFTVSADADIVLVPGGDTRAVRRDGATLDWLRARSDSAEQVLSVRTGAYILADAGLLDGGRATTFHGAFDSFEQQYPDVTLVRDQRWVDNGKVVTSAGLASGIDAALHVVAERLGVRRAQSIALHLEYDWSPEQGFIRGLMADRHLRMPKPDLQFPEGTVVDTMLQLGDEKRWEMEYRVRSPWSPAELVAHLAEAAEADPALTVLETGSPLATGWHYDSEYGGRWAFRIAAEPPAEDGSYKAYASVERRQDQ